VNNWAVIFKWAVIAFGLVVVIFLVLRLQPLFEGKKIVQNQPGPTIAVVSEPSIVHGNPVLPQPDEDITSVLSLTVSDTVKAKDTVGTIHQHEIKVYPRENPKVSPLVQSDLPVVAEFSVVRDPWLQLRLDMLAGGSVSSEGKPSLIGMLSAVDIASTVRLGIAVDRAGAGPALALEVWREWDIVAKYNLLRFDESKLSLGIAYRFSR
jgi:hypothetical protein